MLGSCSAAFHAAVKQSCLPLSASAGLPANPSPATRAPAAALKLVGESYPWGPGSTFLYLRDNHNSVLGVRQLAAQHGAACTAAVELASAGAGGCGGGGDASGGCCEWEVAASGKEGRSALAAALSAGAAAWASSSSGEERVESERGGSTGGSSEAQHLFAFPLESNLTGARYDAGLVEAVQCGALRGIPPGRWRVLLDAAKACGTAPPDLEAHPADFVVLSFYKIFGYPTGGPAPRPAVPAGRLRFMPAAAG